MIAQTSESAQKSLVQIIPGVGKRPSVAVLSCKDGKTLRLSID
ncbi:hypothetical protein [Leptolyngbya sp. FACHB-541]|nr:hypothetical protein [Leptolyngbya sp. FACHB-541]